MTLTLVITTASEPLVDKTFLCYILQINKIREGIDVPVRIRLMRFGRRKRPFYRVVVADSRSPRDGKYIDKLGYYDPLKEPYEFKIDEEKVKLWLSRGAQPTETVRALLRRAGIKV